MRCLNREEMQAFIDNEKDEYQVSEIKLHINKCKQCSALFEKASYDKVFVKRFLDQSLSDTNHVSVPQFFIPGKHIPKKSGLHFLYDLIAASIIGVIIFFSNGKDTITKDIPEADLIMYEFTEGKDLNKLWHDKSKILIMRDDEGNVIESIIKY